MSQALCWVVPHTPRFFKPSSKPVIQVRWHLPVTHLRLLRDQLLPHSVQVGLTPPPAPSRCGQSEPVSGTLLGVVRTDIFPRGVVWGQEVSLELMEAPPTPRREPTSGWYHPRSHGAQRLAEIVSWWRQWVPPEAAVPEASPALHSSVTPANHFPLCC